jgi:hypothetical protein
MVSYPQVSSSTTYAQAYPLGLGRVIHRAKFIVIDQRSILVLTLLARLPGPFRVDNFVFGGYNSGCFLHRRFPI